MKITPRIWRLDEIRPNDYNYNVQDAFTFSKEVNSIRKFGFLVPLTVRNAPELTRGKLRDISDRIDGLMTPDQLSGATKEVTDGEHRLKALLVLRRGLETGEYTAPDDLHQLSFDESEKREGQWVHADGSPLAAKEIIPDTAEILTSGEVPVNDLGDCPLGEARKLTVILNETKGTPDYEALSTLVSQMAEDGGMESLLMDLPFSDDQINALVEEVSEETLEGLFEPRDLPEPEEETQWQRFDVVMPKESYNVYIQARENIAKNGQLHPEDSVAHGQVLEALVAEYLAGAHD